jgi:uncharacterized protein YndB with AHSA1/START domain
MTTAIQSNQPATTPAATDHELVLTRLLEAPRELVWKVWTQNEHLARWCAPQGFTITHSEGDLRPGGAWRTCMQSPESVDHWVGGVYREIVPVERLVFSHIWDGDDGQPGHETQVTVTFAEQGKQTLMTFHQKYFHSLASRDGHEEGWSESFDRLNDYVQQVHNKGGAITVTTPSEREILITRVFNAPRHLVYEAYSKPEHVARWLLGPEGWSMPVCEIDLQVGGAWRYVWRGPEGAEFEMHGVYREIVPSERLVCTEVFEEHEALVTTTFTEQNGTTILRTTVLHASSEARDGHLQSGMEVGLEASYQRLEELLAGVA